MNFEEISALYHQPFFDLIGQSRAIHLEHWHGEHVQRCSLLSIKTGGCSEDCAYCAQSAHYSTGVKREDLMPLDQVLSAAKRARAQGATRFCMGAAWRGVRDGSEKFDRVLEIVREVGQLGMEVCVTLGQIGDREAVKLKAAGVTAYNHNIDTSPEFYPEIVTTHTFADRVNTIRAVQRAGISVCSGGIIGMGVDELHWPNPVRPCDGLRLDIEIIDARFSKSRPGFGIIRIHNVTRNQRDEVVQSFKASAMLPTRQER